MKVSLCGRLIHEVWGVIQETNVTDQRDKSDEETKERSQKTAGRVLCWLKLSDPPAELHQAP